MRDIFPRFTMLLVIIQILTIQHAFGKTLLRWEDNQGNIYYSDRIPPKHVKHRRETLNENARVIDIKEAKKSQQQRDLEARLHALKKEQQNIIEKQKSLDKVLLSTFRNISDLQLAQKNKLSAIASQQKVSQGNLQRLEKQLEAQQKKAAEYERDGKQAPYKLIQAIQSTEKQIELSYLEISKLMQKKRQANKAFERDLERFKFLTGTDANANKLSAKSASQKAADELGLFSCISEAQCSKAWEIARQFVIQFSTTKIEFDSERLIMSSRPLTDKDLSLSISKMARKNKAPDIFLDIRCRGSSLGKELCQGDKALKVRSSFRPFIMSELK